MLAFRALAAFLGVLITLAALVILALAWVAVTVWTLAAEALNG